MQETIKPSWLTMSDTRLRKHLSERLRYPSEMVDVIAQQVAQTREAGRKRSIRKTVLFKAWQDLLAPARAELATVRVLKAQLKKAPEDVRWDALSQYETCIAAIVAKLKKVQAANEQTPMQFVAFLKTQVGRHIPNGGTHWTDFVPPKQRQAISLLFDSLPPPPRGRRKDPFMRRITRAAHKAQRSALYEQLDRVQEAIDREREVATNSFDIDRLDAQRMRVEQAKYALEQTPRNKPLPTRWQALG